MGAPCGLRRVPFDLLRAPWRLLRDSLRLLGGTFDAPDNSFGPPWGPWELLNAPWRLLGCLEGFKVPSFPPQGVLRRFCLSIKACLESFAAPERRAARRYKRAEKASRPPKGVLRRLCSPMLACFEGFEATQGVSKDPSGATKES